MSAKKTSSLLLLLVIFALVAVGSWYFFSNKQAENGAVTDGMTQADNTLMDAHSGHAHDHGPDTHQHDGASGATVGEKGKVKIIPVKPILGERGVGDKNAPVQIREFFSLTCNHCAEFHKTTYQDLKTKYIDTGKVYFIHEEFPLNGPALYGSMIARCLPQERYAGFIDILLRTQDKWAFSGDFKSSLKQNAKLAGMSDDEFEACFSNTELQKAIATRIKDVSDAWEVSSTPSFVVNNGERILRGGQTMETFDKLYNELVSADAASNDNEAPDAYVTEQQREVWSQAINSAQDASDTAIENTAETIDVIQEELGDVVEEANELIEQNEAQ